MTTGLLSGVALCKAMIGSVDLRIVECIAACGPCLLLLFALALGAWQGYTFDSTLGFPGEGPPQHTDEEAELEAEALAQLSATEKKRKVLRRCRWS